MATPASAAEPPATESGRGHRGESGGEGGRHRGRRRGRLPSLQRLDCGAADSSAAILSRRRRWRKRGRGGEVGFAGFPYRKRPEGYRDWDPELLDTDTGERERGSSSGDNLRVYSASFCAITNMARRLRLAHWIRLIYSAPLQSTHTNTRGLLICPVCNFTVNKPLHERRFSHFCATQFVSVEYEGWGDNSWNNLHRVLAACSSFLRTKIMVIKSLSVYSSFGSEHRGVRWSRAFPGVPEHNAAFWATLCDPVAPLMDYFSV